MKLVFVTQELDPAHGALAQSLDLVQALALRVDELSVVTRRMQWDSLPSNATVHTFEAGGKLRRGVRFERTFQASLGGADAAVVHMVPQFAVLAAPLARIHRVPLGLWYTHWHAGRSLRLATRLVDVVLSVDRTSFPLASSKVRGIGHAIDVERFAPVEAQAHAGPVRLLAFGRTARWKGLGTLLDAVELAVADGADVSLAIRGPSLTDDERLHRRELEQRIVASSVLRARAEVLPPVWREDVPALLAAADAVLSPNEPRSGATLDKAVFEAAACARPVISTNAEFAPLLGGLPLALLTPPGDAPALAEAIAAVAKAPAAVRAQVGATLRARVVAGHSLDHWANAVVEIMGEVRSPRGRAGSERGAG